MLVALVGAHDVEARRSPRLQAPAVQIVHHGLPHRALAGGEADVAEGVAALADVAHREPLAHHHDHAARARQLVVHPVCHVRQGQAGLGQVDLQRHLAVGVAQTGGGGDEADLAPHGLEHQHGVGRPTAVVLLVGLLDLAGPVAGHGAVAGGVVDELELGVADIVVNGLGARRWLPGPGRAGGPGRPPCEPCPWSRCRRCRTGSPRRGL